MRTKTRFGAPEWRTADSTTAPGTGHYVRNDKKERVVIKERVVVEGRSVFHLLIGGPKAHPTLPRTKTEVRVSSGNWFEGSQVSKSRPEAPVGFAPRYLRGHKLTLTNGHQ